MSDTTKKTVLIIGGVVVAVGMIIGINYIINAPKVTASNNLMNSDYMNSLF